MNRYTAMFFSSPFVAAFAWMLLTQSAAAEDKSLTLEEAGKLGIKVELSTPKPKVVYAILRFTEVPQEAELVIRNEDQKWIANAKVAISDKSCSAWLAEEYVARSYYRITPKTGGHTYHVPLR